MHYKCAATSTQLENMLNPQRLIHLTIATTKRPHAVYFVLALATTATQLEDMLEPQLRRQRYAALDLPVVALALDKFRELPQQAKRQPGWPTKKAADAVAKQLRSQMVSGAAGMRVLDDV
jgi:hypothetical protein